jgi:hypothetical protein
MIVKLQATAKQAHVNLSEGSISELQGSAKQGYVNLFEGWGLVGRRILIVGVSYMQKTNLPVIN